MQSSSYSRSELQKLAKENGVRANAKSSFIISELEKLGVFEAKKPEQQMQKEPQSVRII